ncbi:MAG: hypothetical protein ACLSVD_16240 [Eggerthellaceae bacterium]
MLDQTGRGAEHPRAAADRLHHRQLRQPAGSRGSSKAQVDGCCSRANMLVTDRGPKDWGLTWAPWSWATPRDLSVKTRSR